jgi:zeaxanthin glucosyltransferase
MAHIGVICPNTPGHLNPMTALGDALRRRGHRVTFFLLGDSPVSVTSAGFEVVPLGGSVFPPDEYRAGFERLGALDGRAALKHSIALGARAAEAILDVGPSAVAGIGVTALLVDQASLPGSTVAVELGLPFATVCNSLLLHPDPAVPPFFTSWRPRDASWARLRNRIAWAGLSRLYAPILTPIQQRRRRLGLSVPARIADTWSSRLQISQQPEAFEFPRRVLLKQVRFVGPLRLPRGLPAGTVPLGPARRSAAHLRVARHPPEPGLGGIPDDRGGVRRPQYPVGHLHRPRGLPGHTWRPAGPAGGCALRAPVGTSPQGRPRGHPRRPEHRP